MMNTLTTEDLSIGYHLPHQPDLILARGLDLSLQAGELVCLIGPNGAGKSTLMRTLAGLEAPLAGRICLLGDDIERLDARERARRLSMVLTERVDGGLLSAYALVALGRHPYTDWTGQLSAHDEAVIRWALDAVSAVPLAERKVYTLSDGERQKVLIARALAQEPDLMLLDEPTAFLDLPRRVEIMSLLRAVAHNSGRAVLLSSHDLDLALRSADRLWLLAAGGTLHSGAPEDLVLSGTLGAAFQTEGVRFDPQTGAFVLNGQPGAIIALSGQGLQAIWTRRALERAGFAIATNGTQPLAEVTVHLDHWELVCDGQSSRHSSLAALIDTLQASSKVPSG